MAKKVHKRPLIHFTPQKGWSNDPNGLSYIDGVYHMFFQHYPDGVQWGPMHWGHAISKDLLHWEELPIALYPDELGLIFSGSCYYDRENKSGLGSPEIPFFGVKAKAPLIAMYTSHYLSPTHKMADDYQQQSIAYSTDLVHFEKYYGNPVIPSKAHDFRDPKMFWNPVKECVSMVVGAGDVMEFYQTENFKEWTKTGEFSPVEAGGIEGVCECPDCFPLIADDGTEKWVLTMSLILPKQKVWQKDDVYDRATNLSQYFVGEFDGDKFYVTEKVEHPLLLDVGIDNYAAVTFQHTEDKILIGWGTNPQYSQECLTGDFNGRMTLPRKLGLIKTEQGYRLTSQFVALDELQKNTTKLASGKNANALEAFGIKVTAGTNGKVIFSNSEGEELIIEVNEKEILVDRTNAGEKDFTPAFARPALCVHRTERFFTDDARMDIVWDMEGVEVLADRGIASITALVFPLNVYDTIEITGDLEAEIYEVK